MGVTANAAKAVGAKAEAVAVNAASAVKVADGVAVAGVVNVPTRRKKPAPSTPAALAVPTNAARVRKAGASHATNHAAKVAVNLAATAVAVRAPSVNRVDRPLQTTPASPTQ